MRHRLFIVEGLPCSGKSAVSAQVAEALRPRARVEFVDEGTGNHPADYEFHALAPAGLVSGDEKIVPIAAYPPEIREKLMAYKIYDALPWEAEAPLMLNKWREFAESAPEDTVHVFNCVLLQNPMCETMMRFGFPAEKSAGYISQIAEIIAPLNPVVIYLRNDDIAFSVKKAAPQRPGWLDAVIDYHTSGAYGRSIAANGFDGYIRCLEERQKRELQILEKLPLDRIIIENPQRDWPKANEKIRAYISEID